MLLLMGLYLLETVQQKQGSEDTGDDPGLDATELSKYLGGDEAHTHLVKGLDVALARSVRKEITSQTSEQQDAAEVKETAKPFTSTEEAWEVLEESYKEIQQGTSTTPFVRSLVTCLCKNLKLRNGNHSHIRPKLHVHVMILNQSSYLLLRFSLYKSGYLIQIIL